MRQAAPRIVAFLTALGLSPLVAQSAGPDAITSAVENGYGIRHAWSAWRYPAEQVWSIGVNCRLHDSAILDNGDTIAIAHCLSNEENKTSKVRKEVPTIIKIDGKGKPVWTKRLDLGEFTKLSRLAIGRDRQLVLSGTRSLCRGSMGCEGPFLVILDEDGKLVRALAPAPASELNRIEPFLVLEKGDLIGTSGSALWRLSRENAVQWARSYGPKLRPVPLAARNGMIISAGHDESNGTVVFATDYEGELLWSRAVAAGPASEIYNAVIDSSGTVHLNGSAIRMGPSLEDKVHPRAGWVVRLSRGGELLSSSTLSVESVGGLRALDNDNVIGFVRSGGITKLSLDIYDRSCIDHESIETVVQNVELVAEKASFRGEFTDIDAAVHDHTLTLGPGRAVANRPCATGVYLNR